MTTYPMMNEQIVDILSFRGDSTSLYAAGRIEELEAETARLREQAQRTEAEVADLKSDLVLNTKMMAQQCDQAREAEIQAAEAKREAENLRAALQAALSPLERAADALVPPGRRVEEAADLVEEAVIAIRETL